MLYTGCSATSLYSTKSTVHLVLRTCAWLFALCWFDSFKKSFNLCHTFKQQLDKSIRVWLFWRNLRRNVKENLVIIRNHVGNTITIISHRTKPSSRRNLVTEQIHCMSDTCILTLLIFWWLSLKLSLRYTWLTGYVYTCVRAYPNFLRVRQLGRWLLPLNGMLNHHRWQNICFSREVGLYHKSI